MASLVFLLDQYKRVVDLWDAEREAPPAELRLRRGHPFFDAMACVHDLSPELTETWNFIQRWSKEAFRVRMKGNRREWILKSLAKLRVALTAKLKQGEGDGGAGSIPEQPADASPPDREAALRRLEPAVRKAYWAFQYVVTMTSRKPADLKDREAHDWLREHGIDSDKCDLGELTDYKLPPYSTFTRNCIEARGALDERKHNARAGRKTGRSIVGGREIERQKGDEE